MTQATITLSQYTRLTEKAWTGQVIELAKTLGFLTYHPWLSIHSARGWPDLALVRERLILAELKSETGKVSEAQRLWIESLRAAKVEVYVWRPSQFDEVVKILTKRANPIQLRMPLPGIVD